jgi:branched-chain amino acid transport system permease protein
MNVVSNEVTTSYRSDIAKKYRSWLSRSSAVILLFAVLALAPLVFESYIVSALTRAMIYGIAASAVGFIIWHGGMVSFGHAAYFGAGAYTALIAQMNGYQEVLFIWPLAMLVGALLALGLGAISLRTRGVSFIMVTLGFAQMLYFVLSSLQAIGAADGLALQGRGTFLGFSLGNTTSFHVLVLCILILVVAALAFLAASPFGAALSGIRQNERRLVALGYKTNRLLLGSFVISATLTSLAGAIAACFYAFVSPSFLHWIVSGELLVMAALGGVGTVAGGMFGALALLLAEHIFSEFTSYWRIILGPLVIVAVLFLHKGLLPAIQDILGGHHGR